MVVKKNTEEEIIPEKINLADKLRKQLNKYFEDDSAIMLLDGSEELKHNYTFFSSGSMAVDDVMGYGVPIGCCFSIMGKPATGKSTLMYAMIASAQKTGSLVFLADAEHNFDGIRGKDVFGIDVNNLMLCLDECMEITFEKIKKLVEGFIAEKTNQRLLIVIDSISMLVPKREIEGDLETKDVPGERAKLIRKWLRVMNNLWGGSNVTVAIIAQSTNAFVSWGDSETFIGEDAILFASRINLRIRRAGQIKEGEEVVGIKSIVEGRVNKIARPYRKEEMSIYFDRGIDDFDYVLDKAKDLGIVIDKKTWFEYQGQNYRKNDLRVFQNDIYSQVVEKRIALLGPKKES